MKQVIVNGVLRNIANEYDIPADLEGFPYVSYDNSFVSFKGFGGWKGFTGQHCTRYHPYSSLSLTDSRGEVRTVHFDQFLKTVEKNSNWLDVDLKQAAKKTNSLQVEIDYHKKRNEELQEDIIKKNTEIHSCKERLSEIYITIMDNDFDEKEKTSRIKEWCLFEIDICEVCEYPVLFCRCNENN